MVLRNKYFQIGLAIALGLIVNLLPRPEGTGLHGVRRSRPPPRGRGRGPLRPDRLGGRGRSLPAGGDRRRGRTRGGAHRGSRGARRRRDRDRLRQRPVAEGLPLPGGAGGVDLPVRGRTDPARDHGGHDRRLSRVFRHRRRHRRLGHLHAPGGGLHHVLSDPRHRARKGRAHRTAQPRHRQKGRHQRRPLHLHPRRSGSAWARRSCTTPPPPPSASPP